MQTKNKGTENGWGERVPNEEMKQLAREFKLNLEKPAPYIHEQSGKVERSHRTILGMARSMMKTACLPDMFWNLAMNAAIYIHNRIPTKGNNNWNSPYESRYGILPDLMKLRVFGCKAYPYIPKEKGRNKLDDRAREAMLVGYAKEGYLMMDQ